MTRKVLSSPPFFTICIPTYNAEDVCAHAIDSALNQSFSDYGILIIDNKSTDNTRRVLQNYKSNDRIRIIFNKTNIGLNANWNKCLKNARGKYIAFVHHDDAITSTYLSDAYEIINHYNKIGIVAFREQGSRARPFFLQLRGFIHPKRYFRYIYSLINVPAPSAAVVINLPDLEYDPNMPYCPEVDLYLNIVDRGYNAYHSSKPNSIRGAWNGSITYNTKYKWIQFQDNFYTMEKWRLHHFIRKIDLNIAFLFTSFFLLFRYQYAKSKGATDMDDLKKNYERTVNKPFYKEINPITKFLVRLLSFFIPIVTRLSRVTSTPRRNKSK